MELESREATWISYGDNFPFLKEREQYNGYFENKCDGGPSAGWQEDLHYSMCPFPWYGRDALEDCLHP